ncbi:MAG: S41 family peptidase [Eubacteriales bacterium]|nr:S41 family peptidase [Eubacteriales bacterium]
MEKKSKIVFGAIVLVILTAVTTMIFFTVLYSDSLKMNNPYSISFDPGNVDIENVAKLRQVRQLLTDSYYKDFDEDELVEGAAAGMAASLGDPYTVYLSKDDMKFFNERSEGNYVGIGVTVHEDDDGILSVVEAYEGSPAKEAGIKTGDKIIEVDGTDTTKIEDSDVVISMIRGEENTKVKITVFRPEEEKQISFSIMRKRIKIVNVTSKVISGGIGYINLKMFDGESDKYFRNNLDELLEQNIRGLIIDVRDNPGGSYDQVVNIVDRLVPKGVIVYTEDRNENRQYEYSDETELEIPLVILINGNSASASEILAGAVKDHKKGTLIGTTTFGKGLVQAVIDLTDGSGLKFTVARYFTPNGICIQDIGVEPDIKVELDEKYQYYPVSEVPVEDDLQLKRAIELINKIG